MSTVKEREKQNNALASPIKGQVFRDGVSIPKQPNYPSESTRFLQRYQGNSHLQSIAQEQQALGQESSPNLVIKGKVGTTIQTRLKVSQPGDKYEQEADRVAEQVMRMPEPRMQWQLDEEDEEELIQTKPLAEQITRLAQSQIEEEELLQAKQLINQSREVGPDLEARISDIKEGGQPLPQADRTFFEQRFGCDFSQVRVHTDFEADTFNRALNARAFTTGQDIFFRQGGYSPGSSSGQELLAHELAHMLQQTRGEVRPGTEYTRIQRANAEEETQTEESSLDEILNALTKILADGLEEFAEECIEEHVPAGKYAIMIVKIGKIFADGFGNALLSVRQREKAFLESRAGGGYSRASIQAVRRGALAGEFARLGSVWRKTLLNAVEGLKEFAVNELRGWLIEQALEPIEESVWELTDFIGDKVGDALSGDWFLPEVITQPTEDWVQDTIREIGGRFTMAMAQSAADYAVSSGLAELERQASEAGKDVVDILGDNVEQKAIAGCRQMGYRRLADMGSDVVSTYRRFRSAYSSLISRKDIFEFRFGGLKAMARPLSDEDERLQKEIRDSAREAAGALFSLGELYLPERKSGVSFEVDRKILNNL